MTNDQTTVKERPILFRGELVRKILAGKKSQTRRPVKPQPRERGFISTGWCRCDDCGNDYKRAPKRCKCGCTLFKSNSKIISWEDCPFGAPGDRLWVKEGWRWYSRDRGCGVEGGLEYRADCGHRAVIIQDRIARDRFLSDVAKGLGNKWRHPNHMPRYASRLTLEITDVRVERLCSISEEDAQAEGYEAWDRDCDSGHTIGQSAAELFQESWDAIYAAKGYGWKDNPWCWVISFRKVDHD